MFESSLLFGLAVALGWGVADLGNKKLVEITGVYGSLLSLNAISVLAGVLVWLVFGGNWPVALTGLLWNFGGAVLLTLGLLAYFRALAIMPISVAVGLLATVAVVPLSFELFWQGLVLSPVEMGTLLAVLVGAVLVAIDTSEIRRVGQIRTVIGLPLIMLAVLFFGVGFILLNNAVAELGWQVNFFFLNLFQLLLLASYFFLTRKFHLVHLYHGRWLKIAAFSSVFAFVALYSGMAVGSVGVITGIANLSVVITAILSYFVLKERLGGIQYLGLGVTALALALLAF